MTALKYTDRDVRENPHYYDMAVAYLEQYQGEFEFLISCKMRLEMTDDLTVGMVRGVLNCMRTDPRVGRMPEPVSMPGFDDDLVPEHQGASFHRVALHAVKSQKGRCTRTDYHSHEWADWNTLEFCPGKYEYERPAVYRLSATSEYGLCVGKSLNSGIVHAISYLEVEWHPNTHHAGWSASPQVIAHVVCQQPYLLRNPLIGDRQLMRKFNFESDYCLKFCGRCLPNG